MALLLEHRVAVVDLAALILVEMVEIAVAADNSAVDLSQNSDVAMD